MGRFRRAGDARRHDFRNSHASTLGHQIAANVALQYRLFRVIWPEVEINSTTWPDGTREGLTQVYLTTGVVLGRFRLGEHTSFGMGVGYEMALAPNYHADPLTPAFDHALIFSTRFGF